MSSGKEVMSFDKESSSTTSSVMTPQTINSQSFGDSSSLQITSHKLDGKNFLQWSQSVLLVIRGRGKMGYITGEAKRPNIEDPTYATWELNNSIVMAWLINSMETHISRTYLFLRTAKAIWDAVKENYSDLENASQVFEIKNKLKDMRQGNLDVTEYYNSLQTLWQELDMFYEADWGDLEENVKFRKHLDKERLYDFLVGLNKDLDEVRGRILGRRPLPSISEAFAEVRREASRRLVMLGGKKDQPITTSGERPMETSALVAKQSSNRRGGKLRFSHCNKIGHTQDNCWDIHGKPANYKPRFSNENKKSGLQVSTEKATEESGSSSEAIGVFLNKSQLEQLHKLLNQPAGTDANSAASTFAHKGTVFHIQNQSQHPWILDSGASDHMTGAGIGEDDWQC